MVMSPTSDFDQISALAALEPDMTIVGTISSTGAAVYFLAPRDADAVTLRSMAFEAKWGRPMAEGERGLLDAALEERPALLDATMEDLTRS